MTREADSGFLSRWSQRKQAARQQERTAGSDDLAGMEPAGAADADTTAQGDAALERPSQEETAAANQAAAESVDLETLGFESDYSVFLKDGVSTQLKNAALRRLWRSNPVLACLDGLNDYDEDYRKVETFAHGVRSSWQVGKGYGWMAEVDENLEAVADSVDGVPAPDRAGDLASGDLVSGEPVQDTPERAEALLPDAAERGGEDPQDQVAGACEGEDERGEAGLQLAAPATRETDDTVRPHSSAASEPVRPARRRVRFT
ncbi:DUF3306 domain-containing protein [Stappia sp. TSB10P1A]|uniref:DUF3306 domain-containing protein n=1 Tax=Stappia sp. TSB10P1A TaxID=2003585 RepID=UPI0016438654|nr:DUF3306 domain-containing protein [Stappia sp. TSB10P1A]